MPAMIRSLVLTLLLTAAPMTAHAAGVESLADDIRQLLGDTTLRFVDTPTSAVVLGGLVMPGQEAEGASASAIVIAITNAQVMAPVEVQLPSPRRLGTLGALIAELGGSGGGKCAEAELVVVSVRRSRLQPGVVSGGSQVPTLDEIAVKLGLEKDDLHGYTVVGGVVTPRIADLVCADRAAAAVAKAHVESLVWAYEGAAPIPVAGAAGPQSTLTFLQAFELDAKRPDRALRVAGFTTNRPSTEVGWISRVKLGRQDPESLADEAFAWWGPAPIGARTLWPGRFYFRLRRGPDNATLRRDLSLSEADKVIQLPWASK